MTDRDWLAGWNPRYARLLASSQSDNVRAGLVDTNDDGSELWFGLELRSPDAKWVHGLDWDDVGSHHPLSRFELDRGVVFGWGTGKPKERKTIDVDGQPVSFRVGNNGWWLVAVHLPT